MALRHSRACVPNRPRSLARVLVLVTIGWATGAAAPCDAAGQRRTLDLEIRPVADVHHEAGPLERTFGAVGLRQTGPAAGHPELAITAGALGVALRHEDDRLKPDVFYDVSGWRLRTRIMSGDSPFEIEGMLLRAAHSFPLFGDAPGSADLP